MFTDSRLLEVVGEIYEAAADPDILDRLAHVLARAFESESALVALDEMPNGRALPPTLALPSTTENFDAGARLSYAEYYHHVNIWLEAGLKRPLPAIVLCQELVDETTFLRHEWFEFCRSVGMFHCLGTAFQIGDNLMAEIGIHRRRAEAPLTEDDRRKMGQLLPHLRRGLQLQQRFETLERAQSVGFDVLRGLAIGVVIVDARSRVIFVNDVAERVLRAKAGITIRDQRLATSDVQRDGALRKLVREAATTSAGLGTSAGGLVTAIGSSGAAMPISVAPLRARSLDYGPQMPAAILTFRDPNDQPIEERALASAFGLTLAEARMAAALAAGATLAEYASRETITTATARTHLKHIFEKTGWRRQADLVRALNDPILRAQKQTNAT
jgi:DNA-binding CsgD family transcriptional regulator